MTATRTRKLVLVFFLLYLPKAKKNDTCMGKVSVIAESPSMTTVFAGSGRASLFHHSRGSSCFSHTVVHINMRLLYILILEKNGIFEQSDGLWGQLHVIGVSRHNACLTFDHSVFF
jgi:hypothetical protein